MDVEVDLECNSLDVDARCDAFTHGMIEALDPAENCPRGGHIQEGRSDIFHFRGGDLRDGQRQIGDEEDAHASQHQEKHVLLKMLLPSLIGVVRARLSWLKENAFTPVKLHHDADQREQHEDDRAQARGEALHINISQDSSRPAAIAPRTHLDETPLDEKEQKVVQLREVIRTASAICHARDQCLIQMS